MRTISMVSVLFLVATTAVAVPPGVDLLGFLPLSAMDCGSGNDIWGWTDPLDGTEYGLMGCNNGTAFVDLSDPENPIYLGKLPTHTSSSSWRDIKVYQDHAFVVSEASNHGLRVFDLTELRDVTSPPATFQETAHLGTFGQTHNVAINEDSGYAYVVGSFVQCNAGLYMVNIQDPANPQEAGCFSADGVGRGQMVAFLVRPFNIPFLW